MISTWSNRKDTVQVNESNIILQVLFYIEYSWIKQIPIQSLYNISRSFEDHIIRTKSLGDLWFPGKIVVETVWNKSAKD